MIKLFLLWVNRKNKFRILLDFNIYRDAIINHLIKDIFIMSCYIRHMQEVLEKAGIEVTKENRKNIDIAIHKIVDLKYKNCPDAWKKIKEIFKGIDEAKKNDFIIKLRNEI